MSEELNQQPQPTQELKKRTWFYVQPPSMFDIAPCDCGNCDTQWSEYEKHLWCADCEKDFIPAHNGIFDGPIPYGAATMMGISFDRVNMETNSHERFDPDTGEYVEVKKLKPKI